jgi:hypothetical protein
LAFTPLLDKEESDEDELEGDGVEPSRCGTSPPQRSL